MLSGMVTGARANEIDILVQKLVDKNVLSQNEAKVILEETKQDVALQNAEAKNDMIPKWVQTMKWNGDFRLRYEWRNKPSSNVAQNRYDDKRWRFRSRFGFTSNVTKDVLFGLRLASGSATDPTSTNQTMGNYFTSKYVGFDQVYIKYTPSWLLKNLTVISGKMPNPFMCTDLVWDGDVTPEGVALQYEYPLSSNVKMFANLAGFIYYDKFNVANATSSNDQYKRDGDDSYIMLPQAGIEYKVADDWKLKAALAYMAFTGIEDTPVTPYGAKGNTTFYHLPLSDTTVYYRYGYQLINPTIELSGKVFDVPIKFVGDYAHNTQAPVANDGWQLGSVIGAGKKARDWQIAYFYKRLEKDAVFGALTDSDFGYGGTGHRGHIFKGQYNITDNWQVALTYFMTWDLNSDRVYRDITSAPVTTTQVDSHKQKNTLQVDTIWKF
jgi:hypothetical protein